MCASAATSSRRRPAVRRRRPGARPTSSGCSASRRRRRKSARPSRSMPPVWTPLLAAARDGLSLATPTACRGARDEARSMRMTLLPHRPDHRRQPRHRAQHRAAPRPRRRRRDPHLPHQRRRGRRRRRRDRRARPHGRRAAARRRRRLRLRRVHRRGRATRCERPGAATRSTSSSTTAACRSAARSPTSPKRTSTRLVNVHFKGVFFLTQRSRRCSPTAARSSTSRRGLARFTVPRADRLRLGQGRGRGAHPLPRAGARRHAGSPSTRSPPGRSRPTSAAASSATRPAFQEHLASITRARPIAVADDIGRAIAALLGDGNRWVTGQRIEVSGGIHI